MAELSYPKKDAQIKIQSMFAKKKKVILRFKVLARQS